MSEPDEFEPVTYETRTVERGNRTINQIKHHGEWYTRSELAEKLSVSVWTICVRMKKGDPLEGRDRRRKYNRDRSKPNDDTFYVASSVRGHRVDPDLATFARLRLAGSAI